MYQICSAGIVQHVLQLLLCICSGYGISSSSSIRCLIGDSLALLIYYYITTLDEEFKHYSKRKLTLATVLYIINRYIPLVYNVYGSPWILFSPQEVCLVWHSAAPSLTWLYRKCIYMFVHSFGASTDF